MKRFLIGFVLGASSSGITWAITQDRMWAAVVGLVVLVLVGVGEFILDNRI